MIRPKNAAPDAAVAGLTAGLIALPQLTTMLGIPLPTIVLGIALPAAIVGVSLAGLVVDASQPVRRALARLAELARIPILVAAGLALAAAFALPILSLEKAPDALSYTADLVLESSGLLLLAIVVGVALGSRGARSPLVWSGFGVGVLAVFLTQVLPNDLGFLGSALRFEVPKTVHYWLSLVAAAGAAAALSHAWSPDTTTPTMLPWAARAAAVAASVVVAALPIRLDRQPSPDDPNPTIDAYHLGEHRWSETFAIDLRFAESGFWRGFPDTRTVVDAPRQEILGALRSEIEAGRLEHDTPVLHLASSFQQWVSTPLGVFAGVYETSLSLEPEVSHQTVGGRLFHVDDIDAFLDPKAYPYVVLEPDELPEGLREEVVAAGYDSIFVNGQGEVFRSRE